MTRSPIAQTTRPWPTRRPLVACVFALLAPTLALAVLLTLLATALPTSAVAQALAQVQDQQQAQPSASTSAQPAGPTGPQAARIVELTERVRAEPPVHERPNPWTVPVRELELELQPLPPDIIQERVEVWLYEVLRQKVRERTRVVIALDRTDDPDLSEALAAEGQRLQAVVNAIIQRARVGVDMLERRGGDATAYNQYLDDVAGVSLNLANPQVLYTQAMAWLRDRDGGVAVGLRLLTFVVIVFAFWFVSRLAAAAVRSAVGRFNRGASDLLRNVLATTTARTIMLIGLVVAVSQLGVDITPLVAAIGAAGLVIGFALQGTLSNFASGILILLNKPFDVGDVINAGGVSGTVKAMTLVNTTILTFDNQIMYVPNNEIWGGVITNVTGLPTRRVDLVFGIAYADDIAKAEAILNDCLANHPLTLDDPAPTIKVHELGDNSVNFIARPWCKTSDYWTVHWDLMRQVKERFDAEGINIPFPQRDLHLPDGPIRVVVNQAE